MRLASVGPALALLALAAAAHRAQADSSVESTRHDRDCLYLYAWCGLTPDNNGTGNDYIATLDANPLSPGFGQVVSIADSPYKWLGAGGLVSFLVGAQDIMMFNVKDPAKPVYSHGFTTKKGACTDEFVPLAVGGFAVTNMCNRTGNAGGGVAVVDRDMRTLKEYTGSISDPVAASTFNPHGVDIDLPSNRMVTSDFVEIASLVKDGNGQATPRFRHTVRIWNWEKKIVMKTIDVGDRANGLMDVKHAPMFPGLFWVSSGLGSMLLVDAITGAVAPEPAYCLQPDCSEVSTTCIMSNTFASGTRLLSASHAMNDVRLLDITNPRKWIELDRYNMTLGGHVVKFHEPTGVAAVSTYFVDQPGTVVNMESDHKVYFLKVISAKGGSDNKLKFLKSVDFTTAVLSKGPSNCHGLAFNGA